MRELPLLMNGAMVHSAPTDHKNDDSLPDQLDAGTRHFREYLAGTRLEKWLRNAARRKARGKQHVNGGRGNSGDK